MSLLRAQTPSRRRGPGAAAQPCPASLPTAHLQLPSTSPALHLLALDVEQAAVQHKLAAALALIQPPVVDLAGRGGRGRAKGVGGVGRGGARATEHVLHSGAEAGSGAAG